MMTMDQVKDTLRELGSRRGPIIVGPWLSEVGFEVLYWVPWLRWVRQFSGLHPDDLWIVSRGGARSWYQDIGAHYVDVLDLFTLDEFRAGNAARIDEQSARSVEIGLKPDQRSAKQHAVTAFDEAIIARVCAAHGLDQPRLLHPLLLYSFFRPFWRRQVAWLYSRCTKVRRLTPPIVSCDLPASYVAMKFYSSSALADTAQHRQWVQDTVTAQVQTSEVVLLHSGTPYDDHGEFPIAEHSRVHRLSLPPGQNLEIQTAVIAGASRYVGTYGGFSYLAPFLGVSTLALYGRTNFRRDHRDLMASVARADLKVPFRIDSIHQGRSLVAKRTVRHAA